MFRRLTFVALGCALGCSAAQRAGERPRASLLEAAPTTNDYGAPARFRYHPRRSAELHDSVLLEDGSRLFVGSNGERWLYDVGSLRVRAASALAPESLVAVQRSAEAAWLYIGESGTSYQSETALGPFTRALAPLTPLAKVTASDRALVGIRKGGRLFRAEGAGASWEAVGPEGVLFADVMLASDGVGLALAVPERHWQTLDHGRTWRELGTAPLGIVGFARSPSGILAKSATGPLSWLAQANPPFTPAVVVEETVLPVAPSPAPSAKALLTGRAAVVSGVYFEVEPLRTASGSRTTEVPKWRLLRGPISNDLSTLDLAGAEGCSDLKLAGFDHWLYVACARPEDPKALTRALVDTEFLRSDDAGATWQLAPYRAKALWPRLELGVGKEGTLAVSGICAAPGEPGCQPSGIHYATASALAMSAVPALAAPPDALLFSSDGRLAYAIGRRTKSDAVVIFVSQDQARHFEAREVEGLTMSRDADGGLGVRAMGAGADGSISVVIRPPAAEERLLVFDQDGRAISSSGPPVNGAAIGASGSQAIAVSRDGSDIWESLNGGASWERIGSLPAATCELEKETDFSCSVSTYCHPTGCEFSDSISRLGWREQSKGSPASLPPPRGAAGTLQQAVKPAIACSYVGGGFKPISLLRSLPSADQAALGGHPWFAVVHDPSSGNVISLRARDGKIGGVERVELLAPVTDPQNFAYSASLQIEGSAALRYRTTPAKSGHIENVEVAWDDLAHGELLRARLPDVGPYRAGDADRNGDLMQTAHPDLLSITDGGLYLRTHSSSARDQPTYFIERNRITTLPPFAWPSAIPRGRQEIVHLAGAHLPLRVLDSTAVVRASWQSNQWTFAAETAGFPDPVRYGLDQGIDLTYLNGRPALQLTWFDPHALHGEAYVLPLSATGALFGARLKAPTQADLGDVPKPCTLADRTTTARIVSPLEAGMRHPVVISAPGEPLIVLLTTNAVLHGTPEQACAAAFDADSVKSELSLGNENTRAILPLDDLAHSWLFRATSGDTGRPPQIDYRMLDCRFDPALEAPPEVFTARGTLVAR